MSANIEMKNANGRFLVGTTFGLAIPCSPDEPEQVYVWLDHRQPERPVQVEGWKGYSIPQRMKLTRAQAVDLIALLAEAVGAVV